MKVDQGFSKHAIPWLVFDTGFSATHSTHGTSKVLGKSLECPYGVQALNGGSSGLPTSGAKLLQVCDSG